MILLTLIALYVLVRLLGRKSAEPAPARVLPIILESVALVLIVIWRALGTTSRTHRY